MVELINELERIKNEYKLDGIKIYYMSKESYCIKGIKNGCVEKIERKRLNAHHTWDLEMKKDGK